MELADNELRAKRKAVAVELLAEAALASAQIPELNYRIRSSETVVYWQVRAGALDAARQTAQQVYDAVWAVRDDPAIRGNWNTHADVAAKALAEAGDYATAVNLVGRMEEIIPQLRQRGQTFRTIARLQARSGQVKNALAWISGLVPFERSMALTGAGEGLMTASRASSQ